MVYINFPRRWNTGTAFQGTLVGEEVLMYNGQVCSDFSIPEERDRCLRSVANEACLKSYPDTTSPEYKQCYSDSVLGYPLFESTAYNGYTNVIRPETAILIACMAFLALVFLWRIM